MSMGHDDDRRHDAVTIEGTLVTLCLTVDDPALAQHLGDLAPGDRKDAVARALAVGVRGLQTMGIGVSVARVGEEINRVLADVTADTEQRVADIIEEGRRSVAESLDPAHRDSVTARTIAEVRSLHDQLLARLDPDNSGGHAGRLVAHMADLLGPSGLLEQRLAAALDVDADDSAFSRLQGTVELRFRELRDLVIGDAARRTEAERGTAKGLDFEGAIERELRLEAGHLGGASVETTATIPGTLGPETKVGDFVLTLGDGKRVVVEAKNMASVGLRGKGGILDELDRAMANREADFAICVSATEAFPAEVGVFGVFGDRVLVVDDGSGTLLGAAVRWAAAALAGQAAEGGNGVDVARLASQLGRIRDLGARISNSKRALSTIRAGVDQVRDDLDALRTDLLDTVDDASRGLRGASFPDPGASGVAVIDQVRAKRSSPEPSGPTRVAISSKSSYG